MVRPARPSKLVVLCYHAVSETWPSELAVTPARLQSQLGRLLRRGYRVTTFGAALAAPPAGRTLVVTFDDAYRSTLTRAFPVLDGLGIPATVFVPTDFAGRPGAMSWSGIESWRDGPHAHELSCLDWDELRWLAGRGWEVGSHTRSHPRLTRLSRSAVLQELEGSRRLIEATLAAPCTSLAYPYGAADAAVVACAGAAGYRAGALLGTAPVEPGPLAWPRVAVYRPDAGWRVRAKLSPPLRRLHAVARGVPA